MSKALVEDLGEGQWLIKPTGEIRKCSRSTAYRIAKKADKAISESETESFPIEEPETIKIESEPVMDESIHELESPNTTDRTTQTANIVEGGTPPIFDLPSLEDLNRGDDGGDSDTFQEYPNGEIRDEAFIEGLKNAEIIEDDEGNRKVRIGDILIGNNPLILTMLRSCDDSLYGWAENKHGIELFNKDARAVQRAFFVKMLGMVSPKMQLELDPSWIIIGMIGWLYGVPMLKILRTRKPKPKKIDKYVNQMPVVVLDE